MNAGKEQVIGIVGGMGPQSGVALLERVIANTKADTDQQHLPAILMSFPHITDRTAFLEGTVQNNPAYQVVTIIRKLERAGATIVGIACNTSHSPEIYDVIQAELAKYKCDIQLLNMPLETCRYIKEQHPQCRRIGIMTTNGTYKSGVYPSLLQQLELEQVIPGKQFQDEVIHSMIYDRQFGIKANPGTITPQVKQLMNESLQYFNKQKADAVILGCTELSLVFDTRTENRIPLIDSTEIFAKALIREATAGKRQSSALHTMYYR